MRNPTLSAVVSIHNEEERLAACLEKLKFVDELVVILDRCTDRSREISEGFGAVISEGAWEREGDRRNAAIAACSSDWVLEVDADEHVPLQLAEEIRTLIGSSDFDWHEIPVDNYMEKGWYATAGVLPMGRPLILACFERE